MDLSSSIVLQKISWFIQGDCSKTMVCFHTGTHCLCSFEQANLYFIWTCNDDHVSLVQTRGTKHWTKVPHSQKPNHIFSFRFILIIRFKCWTTISERKAHLDYSPCFKAFLYCIFTAVRWRSEERDRSADAQMQIVVALFSYAGFLSLWCVTLCLYERHPEHLNPAQGFKGQKHSGCARGNMGFSQLSDLYALFIFCTDFKWKSTAILFDYVSHKGAMMLEAFRNVFAWPALVKRLPVSQELSL